jgi:hypothetical protein
MTQFFTGKARIVIAAILSAVVGLVIGSFNPLLCSEGVKMHRKHYPSHGGIGMVANNVYIVADHKRNELVLTAKRWNGLPGTPQVVIIWRETVIDTNALPKDFKIEESIIISFNADDIEFIDLSSGASGYFER